MNINFTKMNEREKNKAVKLACYMVRHGWDISGTKLGLNTNSGNVYVYREDEPYTLLIDLGDNLMACKTDYDTSEEEFLELRGNEKKQDLEEWASKPIAV